MRNFNTTRTIDLSGYLPPKLNSVQELDAIMQVETPAVRAVWNAVEDCMNEQFLSEATENGIARREKMLQITPYASDSLEDRRFRIRALYNADTPYTRRSLERMLSALCGEDGYALEIKTAEFTIRVGVALDEKKQADSIQDLLERVLPYNMVFSVELLYNTWESMKKFTWGELASMTWKEVKEEVFS